MSPPDLKRCDPIEDVIRHEILNELVDRVLEQGADTNFYQKYATREAVERTLRFQFTNPKSLTFMYLAACCKLYSQTHVIREIEDYLRSSHHFFSGSYFTIRQPLYRLGVLRYHACGYSKSGHQESTLTEFGISVCRAFNIGDPLSD